MRIALEATWLQGTLTGLGQHLKGIVQGMAKVAPEHEYLLLHSTKEWSGPDFGPQFRPASYHCGRQIVSILWNLGRVLAREKPDVYHATCTTGIPPFPPVPCVATIQDMHLLQDGKIFPLRAHLYFRILMAINVWRARRIITISKFTAGEVVRLLNVPERIVVPILLAPCMPKEKMANPKRGKESFILCVGAIEGRKGQLILLDAYKRALEGGAPLPKLKFIGPPRDVRMSAELAGAISSGPLAGKVEWVRSASDAEVAEAYREASLFACPSLYEGFGLPLTEAMSAGLPAICSDIPVFREVAGGYPVFAKPDSDSFAKAICDFFAGGFDSHFKNAPCVLSSYEENAAKTIECYKQVIEEERSRKR